MAEHERWSGGGGDGGRESESRSARPSPGKISSTGQVGGASSSSYPVSAGKRTLTMGLPGGAGAAEEGAAEAGPSGVVRAFGREVADDAGPAADAIAAKGAGSPLPSSIAATAQAAYGDDG